MTRTNEELLLHKDDIKIRDELIENNTKLVRNIANKFNPEDEDVFSEGMIGLIKAINKFDPSKNNKFSTYAYHYIRGAILDYYSRIESKIPDAISLNGKVDDSEDVELIDLLEDEYNHAEQYEEHDLNISRKKFVYHVLDNACNTQERDVFKMYLSGNTRKDITIKYGISRERVRQIEVKVKDLLQHYISTVYEKL